MNKDGIGDRGEALFKLLITEHEPGKDPLFKPHFLGEKWPLIDFFVELVGSNPETPFLLVQVKTTTRGYLKRKRRLKVATIGKSDIALLAAYPAPTYIVGIDENSRAGFIVSANGEGLSALHSLSTEHPLDKATLSRLWNEVNAFWKGYQPIVSELTDSDWK